METSPINDIEISRKNILQIESIQKYLTVTPHLITQIQFLISRTEELKTVLKEIDEVLNEIRKKLSVNFSESFENE